MDISCRSDIDLPGETSSVRDGFERRAELGSFLALLARNRLMLPAMDMANIHVDGEPSCGSRRVSDAIGVPTVGSGCRNRLNTVTARQHLV